MYSLAYENSKSNIKNLEYIADEYSDLATIPQEDLVFGAKCLIINTGKTYKLNSNGEWIEQVGEAGGSLPSVTGEDNGKILGVESGEWAVVENNNNCNIVVAHFTWEDENQVVCDKTYTELTTALTAGDTIIARDDYHQYSMISYSEGWPISFGAYYSNNGNSICGSQYNIAPDDTITWIDIVVPDEQSDINKGDYAEWFFRTVFDNSNTTVVTSITESASDKLVNCFQSWTRGIPNDSYPQLISVNSLRVSTIPRGTPNTVYELSWLFYKYEFTFESSLISDTDLEGEEQITVAVTNLITEQVSTFDFQRGGK